MVSAAVAWYRTSGGPLAMSGVLLHVAPEEPAMLNEMDDALPFVPTARRTFAPADTVSALVQITQGTTRERTPCNRSRSVCVSRMVET